MKNDQKKIKKTKKKGSDQGLVQDSAQELSKKNSGTETDNNEIKTSLKSGQKLPFGKYYKGDKHFYPGNSFNYSFLMLMRN